MKRRTTLMLNLTAVAVFLLSACTAAPATPALTKPATGMSQPGMQMGTSVSGMPVTSNDIDEMFINMMVPHHQGAVAMAQIALERSQRQEIRDMATAIIASQSKEIDQMKAWKQAWYGSSDTPPMSEMPMLQDMPGMQGGHVMDMQADVDALRNAPEPFDLAFIDAMIPHHQSAIDAARLVLQSAVHPEIRELAQNVIDQQQKEIEQMQTWRKTWFPDAPAR